ncbi:MAG: flagellin [Lachnospiraceae bacterium]
MSSVSRISGELSGTYESLASGKRINSGADDAAGLAIAEKENIQIRGYEAGRNNMASAKDAINIADGALGSINDYLQRIRELAVAASNTATVSDSDREAMQKEVAQLLQGIGDAAENTQYNTNPLLDGSKTDFTVATDSNGNSTTVSMADATLASLGIKDFDLTKDFNIGVIDDAISKVNEARSSMGAQSNRLEYAMNYNSSASYYATQAVSRIEDLDYPEAVTEQKKEEALLQYSLLLQKKKAEEEEKTASRLFNTMA